MTLLGGAESRLRADHHDIDEDAEPYEALLYGVPCEGAEVILRYAVYRGNPTIVESVTAAPLLPVRRNGFRGPWKPAGTSHTLKVRAEAERRREERAARADRSSGSGGSGCGSSSSCGSDSSCGSSCGGGCGGGD